MRAETDIDVRDDLPRRATFFPALVAATITVLARLPQPAHGNAFTMRAREDAHDVIVTAPRPNDPVRTIALDAVHRPTPRHQHVAGDDDHAIDRHDIRVFDRLRVDILRARVSGRAGRAGKNHERDHEDHQVALHQYLLVKFCDPYDPAGSEMFTGARDLRHTAPGRHPLACGA